MDTQTPDTGEDRRKHLDFIQAVVTRMSAASSNSKSWLLPVITATYGFALTEHSVPVALLGITAVALFMYIDANYLRLERNYRELYRAVAKGTKQIPAFSLDTMDALDPHPPIANLLGICKKVAHQWIPGWSIWLSWSILPFYGILLVAGLLIWLYAIEDEVESALLISLKIMM
jgi:histidine triad (HIT) family protein